MGVLSWVRHREKRRRAESLLSGADTNIELCGQVSAALGTDTPLADVRALTGDRRLLPKEVTRLIQQLGGRSSIVRGVAFARFYDVHLERAAGAFRAVALCLDDDSDRGHAVYLEGEDLFDPATLQWRAVKKDDLARFDWILILDTSEPQSKRATA